MKTGFQSICMCSSLVSLFSGTLLSIQSQAAPMVKVNNTTFDCGLFSEEKAGIATANFIFQNIGDTLVKIESVRPGCGCIVAAYDTFIAPGKSGCVQLTVNLKGYSGQISKSATVQTNAKNEPLIRVSMNAKILPLITLSTTYINLVKDNQTPAAIILTSLKKDLKIKDILFKTPDNNTSSWQHQLSIPITYEWNSTDSITTEGYNIFKLTIKPPELKQITTGDFIISTNHPEKSEIQISGRIGEH